MTNPDTQLEPACSSCGSTLHHGTLQARGWDRAPYGDEFTDELHRCHECDAWSLVTFVDRFSSSDEMKVHGPLSRTEVTEQKGRIAELSKKGRD